MQVDVTTVKFSEVVYGLASMLREPDRNQVGRHMVESWIYIGGTRFNRTDNPFGTDLTPEILTEIFHDPQQAILGWVVGSYHAYPIDQGTSFFHSPEIVDGHGYWGARIYRMYGQPPTEFPAGKDYTFFDIREDFDFRACHTEMPASRLSNRLEPPSLPRLLSWAEKDIRVDSRRCNPSSPYQKYVAFVPELYAGLKRELNRRGLTASHEDVTYLVASLALRHVEQEYPGSNAETVAGLMAERFASEHR